MIDRFDRIPSRARKVVLLVIAMVALGSQFGCGVYSANSGRVDESIRRVAIQYLENMTAEPNLGVDLADEITRAVQVDNTLKVVDEGDADTIIEGKVMRYSLKEMAARQDLTVNEYQVQIAVILTATIRATGEKLFVKRRFNGTGNYVLNDSVTSEETARKEAAEEIVRDILALVVEDW
jgi:hypothetical protein